MKKWITALACLSLLAACTESEPEGDTGPRPEAAEQPGQTFWQAVSPYCGQAFSGQVQSAPAGDSAWQEQDIRVHLRHCSSSRLLMPLNVGGDRSRTWILERHPWGVTLKHAHRHSDGSPDRISDYGGLASPPAAGTSLTFPADDVTRALLPRATGHEWRMAVQDETLVYELDRAADDRVFRLTFDLTEPVSPPPLPNGWEDLLESRLIDPQ